MIDQIKNGIKRYLVPKSKLIILNYHQLGKQFDQKIHNRGIWNEYDFFKRQLNFLKDHYHIVSLKEGLETLKHGDLDQTLVCLTFDDGDVSIESLVMPLLAEMKVPATFFINTAYGNEKMGYWYNLWPYFNDNKLEEAASEIRLTNDPLRYKALLELEDELNHKHQSKGSPFYSDYRAFEDCDDPLFHFGLHGHEHLRFSMLSNIEQKENLEKNIEVMSGWPNYVPYFAIPFGQPHDWNDNTLKIANELNLIPLLAFQGYNTEYRLPLLRTSVDGMELSEVFRNLSPFQKTYYQLNQLPA